MATFTNFLNTKADNYAAVYGCQLPTQTCIGIKGKWPPVYPGQATGLLDKARRYKEFSERRKGHETK